MGDLFRHFEMRSEQEYEFQKPGKESMTRFSTEHLPAQLLREGKVIYDVTLDVIVVGGPSKRAPRSIVRIDLVQGTVVEKGYYGLRFDFDGKEIEDTVYVKGTALMHRVSLPDRQAAKEYFLFSMGRSANQGRPRLDSRALQQPRIHL